MAGKRRETRKNPSFDICVLGKIQLQQEGQKTDWGEDFVDYPVCDWAWNQASKRQRTLQNLQRLMTAEVWRELPALGARLSLPAEGTYRRTC